jgi:hypothetical protein
VVDEEMSVMEVVNHLSPGILVGSFIGAGTALFIVAMLKLGRLMDEFDPPSRTKKDDKQP